MAPVSKMVVAIIMRSFNRRLWNVNPELSGFEFLVNYS